jgi:hypothetical protein
MLYLNRTKEGIALLENMVNKAIFYAYFFFVIVDAKDNLYINYVQIIHFFLIYRKIWLFVQLIK